MSDYNAIKLVCLDRTVMVKTIGLFTHRLLCDIRDNSPKIGEVEERFTISVGYACYKIDSENIDELCEMANKAENLAKPKGRNQVVYCHELTET